LEITTEPLHQVDCVAHILFELHHLPAATPVHWELVTPPQVGVAVVNLLSGFVIYQNPAHMGYDWFVVRATSMLNHSVSDTQNVTMFIDECVDCAGNQNGLQIVDACGVCGGDSRSCWDCSGTPNGGKVLDACGVCAGDNATCMDCAGVVLGSAQLDFCGVCEGDNTSCAEPGLHAHIGLLLFLGYAIVFVLAALAAGTVYQHYWVHRYVPLPKYEPTIEHPHTYETRVYRAEQLLELPQEQLRRRGTLSAQQRVDQETGHPGDYQVYYQQPQDTRSREEVNLW